MTSTTLESNALKQELLMLENQYWQAIKDKDAKTAMSLTHEPCITTGASGVAQLHRRGMKESFASDKSSLESFEIDDEAEASLVAEDVAILAYEVHEELVVDGKPISLTAADTSVWVRLKDRWLRALHTESFLGDAYGRDREKPP